MRGLNEPSRVRVEVDSRGSPVRVTLGRRRLRVDAVRERWRIDDEWWRDAISRAYFTVVLENGHSATVFRDLRTDTWYVQH